jgi:acyl-CoA dehydrogenase
MAIDFTLDPEVTEARDRIRAFFENELEPEWERLRASKNVALVKPALDALREKAKAEGIWAPHMPREWGGMGLGHLAMAFVSAECGRHQFGAYVLNCHAPDEGNMHTLLHFATDYQKEKFLRPLVNGEVRSCFAMTEPEVAGSDPTGIRTRAEKRGDHWVLNGHKWFISGARGAKFAIVIAKTDPDANPPQARNSAFLVDIEENPGFKIVRDIETMAGRGNHCEITIEDVVVPDANLFGGRGQGHRLGQVRLGPARLAHCMRWIGEAENALNMLVERATKRELHGGVLADKQLIQQMMTESAMELYQCKLMTLHSAYLIDRGMPFRNEVSMTKHHVANTLWRVIDRAIQVHGALGYSSDTPLENMMRHARSARLVDGADEVHLSQVARTVLDAFATDGTVRNATGYGLL